MHRWDFAWPNVRILVDVQGGEWITGRHSRGTGMAQDCRKSWLAATAGWLPLHVTGRMVKDGEAVELLRGLFRQPITASSGPRTPGATG